MPHFLQWSHCHSGWFLSNWIFLIKIWNHMTFCFVFVDVALKVDSWQPRNLFLSMIHNSSIYYHANLSDIWNCFYLVTFIGILKNHKIKIILLLEKKVYMICKIDLHDCECLCWYRRSFQVIAGNLVHYRIVWVRIYRAYVTSFNNSSLNFLYYLCLDIKELINGD